MSARALAALALAATCLGVNAAGTAENNPQATFSGGMFQLPELANPKDKYLIIITPASGGDEVKLSLPAGSTGIRVTGSALPAGNWTWRVMLARDQPESIKTITPADLTVRWREIPDGRVLLVWSKVEGAVRYAITGETSTASPDDPYALRTKIEAGCSADLCTRGNIASRAIDVKPGTEIKWSVAALDQNDIVVAKSAINRISVLPEPYWIFAASNSRFKLQRSDTLSKETASRPALFSYISNQGDASLNRSTAYQAEFALIYDARADWQGFTPRASLEGRLTSAGDQRAGDAMRLRAGGYRYLWSDGLGRGTEFVTNLKYEFERKTGTEKALMELGFTPVYGWLGRYWPGPGTGSQVDEAGNYSVATIPWIQLAPVLSFGGELGRTLAVGSSSETQSTVIRLRSTARVDAELNGLAGWFRARSVSAFLEGSYWYLPREELIRSYHIGKTGLSFGLTENLSFDLAYGVGREAPSFRFSRVGTAGLGLRF